jgi:O-antigen/teichoic acid export membrane protein
LDAPASRGFYFGVMGFAAAISLVRGFALASLLPIVEFGIYAIVFAIGSYCSNFLGFGKIEGTRKRFPRMYLSGAAGQVSSAADRLGALLLFRAVAALFLIGLACTFFGRTDLIKHVTGCAMVAFGGGWSSVAISAHRSVGDYNSLAISTLCRALAALILGCVGAWYGGWYFAIVGEFFGSVIGAIISRAYVRKIAGVARYVDTDEMGKGSFDSGGLLMFLSFSAVAAPFYLDRLFVNQVLGANVAGTYAFLMLFVTGATVLLGIIEQQIGPEIIKLREKRVPVSGQLRFAGTWLLGMLLLVATGMGAVSIFLFFGPGQFLISKYALSPVLLAAVTFLCALQITTTLDWVLQANDNEKGVLMASLAYLLCIVIFAAIFAQLQLELTHLILALAMAKSIHIVAQFFALHHSAKAVA